MSKERSGKPTELAREMNPSNKRGWERTADKGEGDEEKKNGFLPHFLSRVKTITRTTELVSSSPVRSSQMVVRDDTSLVVAS
ncbi:hypothetical protein Pmani_036513 [Petrolisthes manimaculis]|uniref:Uncharacterized protein n=1 Tax=Petrolisthes manimaculis TaxID=1843537 RepID=A0AAE1TML0_9EUCA|nr:hypothetical protein Pmani_036513 [Petrolisthes manimaculis]